MENNAENLAKVKINVIHCSSLFQGASLLIIEDYILCWPKMIPPLQIHAD